MSKLLSVCSVKIHFYNIVRVALSRPFAFKATSFISSIFRKFEVVKCIEWWLVKLKVVSGRDSSDHPSPITLCFNVIMRSSSSAG